VDDRVGHRFGHAQGDGDVVDVEVDGAGQLAQRAAGDRRAGDLGRQAQFKHRGFHADQPPGGRFADGMAAVGTRYERFADGPGA